MKKKFKEDMEISLEIDAEKTLQQNYNNYMEAITKTMNKHAPLITKTKTKKRTQSLVWKRLMEAQNPTKDG